QGFQKLVLVVLHIGDVGFVDFKGRRAADGRQQRDRGHGEEAHAGAVLLPDLEVVCVIRRKSSLASAQNAPSLALLRKMLMTILFSGALPISDVVHPCR